MKKLSLLMALLVLAGGMKAFGNSIVYNDPIGQGTQAWGGNLALTFNVNSPVSVDALGVFNASGSGTITGPISVAIYDIGTSSWVTPTVTFSGNYATAGLGYDVFQAITPVTLREGSYEVDAFGFSAADLNGNLNTGSSSGPLLNNLGGALTFTGAAWDYDMTGLDAPTSCATCQNGPSPQNVQFDAGTFEVAPATVTPEPSSWLLLGTGLFSLAGMVRRKLRA